MVDSLLPCSKKMINLPPACFLALLLPMMLSAQCTDDAPEKDGSQSESLKYRIAAIVTILFAGGVGVTIPQLGKKIQALNPDNDIFFMVKAFAAGVILATGFLHILPVAFQHLNSPCLPHHPWAKFPFAGFIAMTSAIGTLMVDTLATSFYQKLHFGKQKARQVADIEETGEITAAAADDHAGHVHVHSHATDGHAHGSVLSPHESDDLVRHRIISQVLELGIIVHSVIIGISLGASQSVSTIKSLLAALSFHQFFEGTGLGGCISQAKFKSLSTVIMAVFFSLTTPVGIAIGIGVSSSYKGNSPTALIVEGTLNSASAGILVYMALVDLLAADFMNPRMQSNLRLQLGAYVSLFLGAGCMSLLAIWA